jgi:diguanylate cyclase (GGDEF)-like protein/PAS domain S-box-containing protein
MSISAVIAERRPLDNPLRVAAFAAVIALCCWWSIVYTRGPLGLSTLWVASGVLCGFLLTLPRRQWLVYILAAFGASLIVNFALNRVGVLGFALSFANTLDAFLVAWIVSQHVPDPSDLSRINHSVTVATLATLVACTLSALIAATARSLIVDSTASFEMLFQTWLASHALGMAIFATLTITARVEGRRMLGQPGRRLELAVTLALIALVAYEVFWRSTLALPFLVYPPLLFCIFRHRFGGFVYASALIAAIAAMGTTAGLGPFQYIADAGEAQRTLMLQLFIASTCLIGFPMAAVLTERRVLAHRVGDNERKYRLLADNSSDLIGRVSADNKRIYISPSVTHILGWTVEEFSAPRWDLVHPDDHSNVSRVFDSVLRTGNDATALFRMRHKDGHYVWIEIKYRRVDGEREGDPPAIVYFGRDVTARIEAQRAIGRNQRRLRAITDNLPAFVLHVDLQQRYTFVNAYTGKMLGIDPKDMIGRTVREVMGPGIHAENEPRMQAAFRGETVRFEIERDFQEQHVHFQSTYVPDIGDDGTVHGFYAVSFDISQLKHAERALEKLARHDTLTGLANRLHFNERVELAIARLRRHGKPLALLYLDIDHFKQINDSRGHAAGDEVLREFSRRLIGCLRATDFAARLGGDEFVVLVEDLETEDAPQMIAAKLVEQMSEPISAGGSMLYASTSIGIALCREAVSSADELMHIADQALYSAKAAGRNTWRMA